MIVWPSSFAIRYSTFAGTGARRWQSVEKVGAAETGLRFSRRKTGRGRPGYTFSTDC
jgi:hypothetical protein